MFKPRTKLAPTKKRRDAESESGSQEDSDAHEKELVSTNVKRKKAGIDVTASNPDSTSSVPQKTGEEHSERPDIILTSEEAIRLSTIANASEEPGKSSRVIIAPGPTLSSANIRASSRFDYQMDICKDYKETGYCGFGDSCIFLHDRSDYKTGWELEREWEAQQKNALKRNSNHTTETNPEVDQSTICAFCKREWNECETPGCTTTCKHYFCEKCFLSNASVRCTVCGKPTQGIFNSI